MEKWIFTLIIMICFCILTYIISHITPNNEIRTHLFVTGHPIVALTTGISDDYTATETFKYKLHEDEKCYVITKEIQDIISDSYTSHFVVGKKGLLFFAEYLGFNFRDI